MLLTLVIVAGFWAGLQNALAGGGSFITLPALILSGMTPLAANITSTVALFPGQVMSGVAGRRLVTGANRLPFSVLFGISVVGGALGGVLLLVTPSSVFARLVPWLVLFATAVFAWGSFVRRPQETKTHLSPRVAAFAQRHKIASPILTTVAEGILVRRPTEELLHRLMTAPMSGYA